MRGRNLRGGGLVVGGTGFLWVGGGGLMVGWMVLHGVVCRLGGGVAGLVVSVQPTLPHAGEYLLLLHLHH